MARLNLTLDADTFQKLDRHSGRVGRPRARVATEILREVVSPLEILPPT